MDPLQFAVSGLELADKTILDAGTGVGRATAFWAGCLEEQDYQSRIISVDLDLSPARKREVEDRLGSKSRFVELVEGDIRDLSFLQEGAVDIVSCSDTIIFLSDPPLSILRALAEFKRVLTTGGHLIITSEFPSTQLDQEEGQWARWQLIKSVAALQGTVYSTEFLPEELDLALQLWGFKVYDRHDFSPVKITEFQPLLEEWRLMIMEQINNLPWDEGFRLSLQKEVDKICSRVQEDGYLMGPGKFVLKARKGLIGAGAPAG